MYNSYNSSQAKGREHATQVGTEPGPSSFAEAEDEHVLSLRDLFQIFWRRMWVIGLVMLVLAGLVLVVSLMQTPVYQASVKLLVGQERKVNPQDPVPTEGAMGLRELTKTIAEGINSRPVAEAAIQRLNFETSPENIRANLDVEQVPDTQFIEVSYRDTSPERASQVADAIGDAFSEQVAEISPTAGTITAPVWERATTPSAPVSPNPVRNTLVALVLGLILGTVLAFVLEFLDDSWRSPEEAEQISGVPTFGVIPEFKSLTDKKKRGYVG